MSTRPLTVSNHGVAPECPSDRQRGFTLIEIVITLVVSSILAAMTMQFMGTSFSNSVLPVTRLQQVMTLQTAMENMRASFAVTRSLATLKTSIGTGFQENNFGTYTVVTNAFIKFDPTTKQEMPGIVGDGILKVTIMDEESGQRISELFVDW